MATNLELYEQAIKDLDKTKLELDPLIKDWNFLVNKSNEWRSNLNTNNVLNSCGGTAVNFAWVPNWDTTIKTIKGGDYDAVKDVPRGLSFKPISTTACSPVVKSGSGTSLIAESTISQITAVIDQLNDRYTKLVIAGDKYESLKSQIETLKQSPDVKKSIAIRNGIIITIIVVVIAGITTLVVYLKKRGVI